ncbi:protein of unknown function [Halovenus aranensis]|uniref:Transglutaminase-like domain-containing protein n=1 Tax=Halovenus aranensis TaxID=890420 RepID=A0A1G8S4S0_9EURY|nr:transglutaminase domain-containing protein [Halovenus aranensis]SDJ24228.1 protein of unknown function [Halovenus aranensis]
MTARQTTATWLGASVSAVPLSRVFALGGTVGLLASFLLVLFDVVGTVGDPLLFYPVVLATLLSATLLSRVLRLKGALAVTALLFVAGTGWHVLTLEVSIDVLTLVSNNIELLTGESVLRIRQADVWALTVVPTPIFVTWYLALREQYLGAVVAGGGMLTYLVLTGDAGTTVTLLGVVSGAVSVAFGEIEATGWSGAADQAVVVLAAMVLVPLAVTVVPGGTASPVSFLGDDTGTMEGAVITGDASLDIVGEVTQTPEPRFVVTSEEPRLWRTGSYDRYTGDGWIRTGESSPLSSTDVDGPPGPSRELTQTVQARQDLDIFPAAWQPVAVGDSVAAETLVNDDGGFGLDRTFEEGETVEVRSAVPDADRETLLEAGQNYPESIRTRYTQLPSSTPDRVGERTAQITQGADSAYETAVAIEQWLEANRGYSLDVDRPEGDIADAFLFEMNEGYCTYYATTMVAMLRSQGVPARMAVGYTPGEAVGENEYLVRGLNSHTWVEVYFPDVGWVEFDPTPADPRQETERAAVGGGTGGGGDGGSGDASDTDIQQETVEEPVEQEPATTPDDIPSAVVEEQFGQGAGLSPSDTAGGDGAGGGFSVPSPSREQMAVSLVAVAGLVAWTRQAGIGGTLLRRLSVRFRQQTDPETDVERAYEELLLVLESRHRPRRTGETVRQYLDDVYAGEDARRVLELYEQARYADGVTRADADEALERLEDIRAAE